MRDRGVWRALVLIKSLRCKEIRSCTGPGSQACLSSPLLLKSAGGEMGQQYESKEGLNPPMHPSVPPLQPPPSFTP